MTIYGAHCAPQPEFVVYEDTAMSTSNTCRSIHIYPCFKISPLPAACVYRPGPQTYSFCVY